MSPIISPSGGDGGGSQPEVLVSTAHLSAAQILALSNTNGVQLVAAPGANKVVYPLGGFLRYNAGATPYTVINLSFAELYVAHDGLITSTAQMGHVDPFFYLADGFLSSATSLFGFLISDIEFGRLPAQADPTAIVNKALKLYFAWPPDGDSLTLGNGTLDVSLSYFVATLP